jgi:transketolase N-terminal domain/subunit
MLISNLKSQVLQTSLLDSLHGELKLIINNPSSFPNIPFALGSLGHGFPIACGIALSHKLILLTRNYQHFSKIPGLLIEDWTIY